MGKREKGSKEVEEMGIKNRGREDREEREKATNSIWIKVCL